MRRTSNCRKLGAVQVIITSSPCLELIFFMSHVASAALNVTEKRKKCTNCFCFSALFWVETCCRENYPKGRALKPCKCFLDTRPLPQNQAHTSEKENSQPPVSCKTRKHGMLMFHEELSWMSLCFSVANKKSLEILTFPDDCELSFMAFVGRCGCFLRMSWAIALLVLL